MDKDHRDDFTFARLSDLKLPVTFRMQVSNISPPYSLLTSFNRSQLEGIRKPKSFTEVLENPDLQFHGVQSS